MPRIQRFLPALLLIAMATPAAAQRLPGTAIPEHYTLSFAPDLEKETFQGKESITVTLTEPATTVTLHAAEIAFGEVTITSGGRSQVAKVTMDAKTETATFTVPQQLAEGKANIDITYTGVLNDKLRGFYISKSNGRKFAVSQLEATDARRAFPSFDEPIYKATYDISLTVNDGDTAISNGKVVSDKPGPTPGKHTMTFARTAKMSSYLAAMIVGDFACREGSADGIPVRVCATPDKSELTGFALEAAIQQLKFYNTYFGIKYPFEKLDIIGVPDFSAGAMENIGAIVFRERLLLLDPKNSSLGARKNVAGITAHEIAHQWFGDLVTMKWWDDIWLNEGFATWMATKPLAAWHPEWRLDLDEAEDSQSALSVDALKSTRPIHMKVETPDEINEVFDGIAYNKTAAVLRMIESYVGPEPFRKGVASYLKKHSYSNAAGVDFWTEVARVTGKPVDRIMKGLVEQTGAPVISARNSCSQNTNTLSLTMDKFVGVPGATTTSQAWTLPVCYRSMNGQAKCELMDKHEMTIRTQGCAPVFVNAESRGYYFTDYSPESVRALLKNQSSLKETERISLINDEWWMALSGRHDIDVYLDLAAAMAGDETPTVTSMIARRLESIGEDIVDASERPHYEAWIRARFSPALKALGPLQAGEDDLRQTRRATLMALLGITGNDPDVQRQARELVQKYIANPNALPGTLAPTVLAVAAQAGDAALYDQYVAQMNKLTAQPELYYRYFNALSSFRDPALIKRTLDFSLSPNVRSQDAPTLIDAYLVKPWSSDIAWDFTKSRWPDLMKKLDIFQGIPNIVESFAGFCSTTRASEVKAFFTSNPVPAIERTLRQSLERVDSCVALDARQSKPFTEWLQRQS